MTEGDSSPAQRQLGCETLAATVQHVQSSGMLLKEFKDMKRTTFVAHGRLSAREIRLRAARERRHGVQVMTFEQLAARLAGGFVDAIDSDTLREVLQTTLSETELGELDEIKTLPGMAGAAADTLHKAWRTGIDLRARASDHPRLAAMADLEEAVLKRLPTSMKRPVELAALAQSRLRHAPAVFGEIEIVGISELSPCWRGLLFNLAEVLPVRWMAGPRSVPAWLEGSEVEVHRSNPTAPEILSVSAATAYHEVIEALRWARELVATGEARPEEIAIAAAAPSAYDDEFIALRSDANLDIHFVHGVRVVNTREGQAAAALADILVRGLSQTRLSRLTRLVSGQPSPLGKLPEGWLYMLPTDAPLSTPEAWERFFSSLTPEAWPEEKDCSEHLKAVVELLLQGTEAASDVGEEILSGVSLRIWRKALLAGSHSAIDVTLEALRQDDASEACVSIAWMPASALAASPRPFVRLLGLTSVGWPRRLSEDRLISDHIIPSLELDPLPVTAADRRDFGTIMATSERQVVLSRARRDSDGRLLGRSPLLRGTGAETYSRRNRRPSHAFSETDRLLARPSEFRAGVQSSSAMACWKDWQRREVTPHDGLVRSNHPAILAAIERVQSASSLSKLLRNPLGFTWRYALGLRSPETEEDPIVLDARATGSLLHEILERSVQVLEQEGGFAKADEQAICSAVERAAQRVKREWEESAPVPPTVVWRRTLVDVEELAKVALQHNDGHLPGQKCFTEVAFGGRGDAGDGAVPWNTELPVRIAGTDFLISGYIDRVDLSGDGTSARVHDYKSGRMPRDPVVLDGGKELQRCLYAFAVKALLGDHVEIEAGLIYPRGPESRKLPEPELVLEILAEHLRAARTNLLSGKALMGPDTGGDYDDLGFALPANAANAYCKRKADIAHEAMGDAALVWDAE